LEAVSDIVLWALVQSRDSLLPKATRYYSR